MKGIVFTEFLEMVEDKFGMDVVNDLLANPALKSGGVYSSVGTYDHMEIVMLVVALSQRTGMEVPVLLRAFGKFLFGTFKRSYPHMFEDSTDAFDFLQRVDQEVHVEVLKLYPDAELPSFETQRLSPNVLQMDYRSDRSMADLAHGLIEACGAYYEEGFDIEATPQTEDGKHVQFVVTRQGPKASHG
ncbi:MAG: heme NO-binding domain-containing protein [Flavobacteriales bacterium]|nr:heme NO-binding domain-containing protein [Flavobacteriales bacterium]